MNHSFDIMYELPHETTSLSEDAELIIDGRTVAVRLRYLHNPNTIYSVVFDDYYALQHKQETCCTADDVDLAYDRVVSIVNSAWIKSLSAACLRMPSGASVKHFMLYMDSFGLLEVAASRCEFAEPA